MDRAVYAGMLRAMDRNIGKVLDALKSAGIEDNTLVVFINDNGGPPLTAEPNSYNRASNDPHRGHKYDALEGGIRVPLILRWPGRVPAGKTFPGLTSALDLLPTFLAAIGQPAPATLDGVNLLPFVSGEKTGDPHEALFWQVNHGTAEHPHQFAVRSGSWKLHQGVTGGNPIPKPGHWQLYDLRTDPGESRNLAAEHPDIAKRLAAQWKAWRSQMLNAALPTKPKAKRP
jgi:arylsulfatase A-like enzyme